MSDLGRLAQLNALRKRVPYSTLGAELTTPLHTDVVHPPEP